MEQKLEQIREQQKETWNKFSPGWKKWDDFTMNFLKPMGDEIINALRIKDTDDVLDVATGTGEPGLTLATRVKKGKVIGTDLSEGMLEVAMEHARKKGIKNYETLAADVCELPFNDSTFDAISCRMGFMFFPDMGLAAKEMARVLKPGGRIATSVWGAPEKNFWVTAMMGTISRNMEVPSPPPGSPGMFRCAKPGTIAELFQQAGIKNVTEKEISGKVDYETLENYWAMMTEVAAPVVAAMSKADDSMKAKIKKEAFATINQKYPTGPAMDYASIIISGTK